MPAKKWDKQRVIDAVRRRQQQGRPLNRAWQDDPALYAAAKYQFGSWKKTLQAMKIPGARSHTRWPQDRVLAGIRARQRHGVLTKTWQDDRLSTAASP